MIRLTSKLVWVRSSAFSLTFYAFRDDEILRIETLPRYSLYLGTLGGAILLWIWNPTSTTDAVFKTMFSFSVPFLVEVFLFSLLSPFLLRRLKNMPPDQLTFGRGRSTIQWSEITSISLWKMYRRVTIRTTQKKYLLVPGPFDLLSIEDYIRSHSSAPWVMLNARRNMIIAGVVLILAVFATLFSTQLYRPLAQSPVAVLLSLLLTPVYAGLLAYGLFVPRKDPK